MNYTYSMTSQEFESGLSQVTTTFKQAEDLVIKLSVYAAEQVAIMRDSTALNKLKNAVPAKLQATWQNWIISIVPVVWNKEGSAFKFKEAKATELWHVTFDKSIPTDQTKYVNAVSEMRGRLRGSTFMLKVATQNKEKKAVSDIDMANRINKMLDKATKKEAVMALVTGSNTPPPVETVVVKKAIPNTIAELADIIQQMDKSAFAGKDKIVLEAMLELLGIKTY